MVFEAALQRLIDGLFQDIFQFALDTVIIEDGGQIRIIQKRFIFMSSGAAGNRFFFRICNTPQVCENRLGSDPGNGLSAETVGQIGKIAFSERCEYAAEPIRSGILEQTGQESGK